MIIKCISIKYTIQCIPNRVIFGEKISKENVENLEPRISDAFGYPLDVIVV